MAALNNGRRRRPRVTTHGAFLALAIPIIVGLVGSRLSPYGLNDTSVGEAFSKPSFSHPFGTDQIGRDVFTRVLAAIPINLTVALVAVTIPFVVGTVIGAIIGVTPSRWVRSTVETVLESVAALPLTLFALAVVAIVGPGLTGLIGAVIVTNWARYARISSAAATKLRTIEYVEAARLLGYSWPRILVRHVVPNSFREALAYAYNDLVVVMLLVASLSFLGLGVVPPTPELGAMIRDGRLFLGKAPWLTLLPGGTIVVLSVLITRVSIKQSDPNRVV